MYTSFSVPKPESHHQLPKTKSRKDSCSEERRLLTFDVSKIFDSRQIFYIRVMIFEDLE